MQKKLFFWLCYYLQSYNPPFSTIIMTENFIQFISQIVVFADEELEQAAHLFTEKTLRKGEFWVKEGEYNADMLFVNKGMLRSYFLKDEIEKTFDLTIENQLVTSTYSYSFGLPSKDFIQAVEDTHVIVVKKEHLEILYQLSGKWERLGRLLFESYANEQEIRLRSFIAETAQERYERLADTQPELIRRTPQIYLANFLGITPQSLSRLRRKIVNK